MVYTAFKVTDNNETEMVRVALWNTMGSYLVSSCGKHGIQIRFQVINIKVLNYIAIDLQNRKSLKLTLGSVFDFVVQ